MSDASLPLVGCRVITALNGVELFGHERGNIEVFKALRGMGAEILVGVNTLADNDVREHLHHLGFDTFPLPFGPQWSWQWVRRNPSMLGSNPLAALKCSFSFFRACREFRPTHVHLGSLLAYSFLALSLEFIKLPLIYRMGDCAPVDSRFNMVFWRRLMRRASRVVCNSGFVRDSALAGGARDATVIYNTPPTRGPVTGFATAACPPPKPSRLIYVGSISEHKGLLELVEAVSVLKLELPELALDIVGGSRYDGAFRKRVVELIGQRSLDNCATLHGFEEDPGPLLRRAQVHVAPSVWEEPLGNVVLEAKREGAPSVVFPSGGLPEIVRHRIDGYICRERSVDALVDALRWMLADRSRLAEMGRSAIEDSESRFGMARFEREWAAVYVREVGVQ
jgi:glycosyltransferase involved in cell wall biosynthesis